MVEKKEWTSSLSAQLGNLTAWAEQELAVERKLCADLEDKLRAIQQSKPHSSSSHNCGARVKELGDAIKISQSQVWAASQKNVLLREELRRTRDEKAELDAKASLRKEVALSLIPASDSADNLIKFETNSLAQSSALETMGQTSSGQEMLSARSSTMRADSLVEREKQVVQRLEELEADIFCLREEVAKAKQLRNSVSEVVDGHGGVTPQQLIALQEQVRNQWRNIECLTSEHSECQEAHNALVAENSNLQRVVNKMPWRD